MALAIGSLTKVSVGATTASLLAPAATGGTGSIAYQWYRSTSSPPNIGTDTIVTGATSLSLSDSGLTPGTVYYYQVVADDSGDEASSAVLTVTTSAQSPDPNQFTQAPMLGMLDQHLNYNTVACLFDPAGSGTLVAGQAVKFSAASDQGTGIAGAGNGEILVEPSDDESDDICGFVNYDIKSAVFAPGDRMQVSMTGNVMYLYAALALTRGDYVTSLPSGEDGGCNGGVVPATGSSGNPIAGVALDTAAIGTLARIRIMAHSHLDD